MEKKIEVGVLGATGMVGQHFVKFLRSHPWFELTWVGASDRSAGKLYKEATAWRLEGDLPSRDRGLARVHLRARQGRSKNCFLGNGRFRATEIERSFAQAGHVVVSNSRNHRMEADVPLLVPEVNYSHLEAIRAAAKSRLEGHDCDQSELLDHRDDARAGAP